MHYSLEAKGPNNVSMSTAVNFPNETIPLKPARQLHRVKFHKYLQFPSLINCTVSKFIKKQKTGTPSDIL